MTTDDIFKLVGRLFIDSQITIETLQVEVERLREKYEPKEAKQAEQTKKIKAA